MMTINEMFANTYVIVPTYKETGYGYRTADRGDMTDDEWRAWMRAKNLNPVKKILGHSKDITSMLHDIIEFLTGEGVRCAVVNTQECSMVRNGII